MKVFLETEIIDELQLKSMSEIRHEVGLGNRIDESVLIPVAYDSEASLVSEMHKFLSLKGCKDGEWVLIYFLSSYAFAEGINPSLVDALKGWKVKKEPEQLSICCGRPVYRSRVWESNRYVEPVVICVQCGLPEYMVKHFREFQAKEKHSE